MKVRLLIVQLESVAEDIDKNIQKAESLLNSCNYKSPDIIILPELWTTGWDCESFDKTAEELCSSKTYKFLQKVAVQYNSNVIGGSAILKKTGEKNRNTCIILNRKGCIIGIYDKYHLFSHRGQSEGTYLEEGNTALLVNTDVGKIGISICYDIRFPELFRLYAFNNADLIVNMAAWPKAFTEEYTTLSRARAIENQVYFACTCLTGKINESFNFSGNSAVYDYKGRTIASLKEEETVLETEIDISEMKLYREQMPILKDTKEKYQILEL